MNIILVSICLYALVVTVLLVWILKKNNDLLYAVNYNKRCNAYVNDEKDRIIEKLDKNSMVLDQIKAGQLIVNIQKRGKCPKTYIDKSTVLNHGHHYFGCGCTDVEVTISPNAEM